MNTPGQIPSKLISLLLDHVDEKDLYACILINKTFYKETVPLLWRKLNIRSEDNLLKLNIAMATSPHSPSLHVRSLSVGYRLVDRQLFALIKHVPFLDHLQLWNAVYITDLSLKHVASRCPRLTTLEIHRTKLSHASMVNIGKYCHGLSILTLGGLPNLDYTKLFSALQACPLKSITLKSCTDSNGSKSYQLAKAAVLTLNHQQQLTSLTIDNYAGDYSTFITTASDCGLVWPHLTYLHLNGCHALTDTKATRFLQAHSQLLHLDLRNSMLTDRTLNAIPTALPVINHLTVNSSPLVTGAGICRLAMHCDHLEEGIDCYGCDIFWQDDDFPHDLLHGLYETDITDGGGEVIWLSGHAFDRKKTTVMKAYHRWNRGDSI